MCDEFKRVADEIGTEGKLGPQAEVWIGGGPWKAMLDSFNSMAGNLTCQLRDFNRGVALLAKGDFSRPVTCPCQGETLGLKNGINAITDRLRSNTAQT
jgi:hypothetical protein